MIHWEDDEPFSTFKALFGNTPRQISTWPMLTFFAFTMAVFLATAAAVILLLKRIGAIR